MWILFSRPDQGAGFMSIVAKDAGGKPSGLSPDSIVSVRFRRSEDAAKVFPDLPYVATPHGDYAGRVFATRAQVGAVLTEMAMEQNATNFKSSIPKEDKAFYNACMSGWSVFGKLQPGGPYGRTDFQSRQPALYGTEDWSDYRSLPVVAGIPKEGKAKRRDPFCDACGIRFGTDVLIDGFCPDCDRLAKDAETSGAPADGEAACWSCGLSASDLPATHPLDGNDLCPDCAVDYADAGYTDADIAEERRQCEEMVKEHGRGV